DGTRRDLEAGVLKAGQPFYLKSLTATEHRKQFLLFAARHLDPSVTRADIDALCADPEGDAALGRVLHRIILDADIQATAEAALGEGSALGGGRPCGPSSRARRPWGCRSRSPPGA